MEELERYRLELEGLRAHSNQSQEFDDYWTNQQCEDYEFSE